MHNDVMVTVCCNAYNHEAYIAQTIESIVNQKTDFKFELIIHDDASTDKTAEIISEYAEKYPDIIVPLLETENQYRKGADITRDIVLPHARGKYFAFCEGDDFWNNNNKLQIQVDILEADNSISMCCHAHRRINAKNDKLINISRATTGKTGCIGHIDCLSEGNFPHLTSMVIRTERYVNMPHFFCAAPIGDYPIRAYALAEGKVYYIDEDMSSYRVMSPSSWSKAFRYNADYRYETNKKMDDFLREYDTYTDKAYHGYINDLISRKDFVTAIFTGHYSEARESGEYAGCGIAKKLLISIGLRNKNFAMKLGYMYSHIKNKLHP